jgi:tetratricopeptide (TPR) repeat protein
VAHPERRGGGNVAAVSDDEFAAALKRAFLASPGSKERDAVMGGVFKAALVRGRDHFNKHANERAMNTVQGAFMFLRNGELRPEWFAPEQVDAVDQAARVTAKDGDEGRAAAFYDVLEKVGDQARRDDAKYHSQAIEGWLHAQGPQNSALGTGAVARAKLVRAVIEPSAQSKSDAAKAVAAWIDQAVRVRNAYRTRRTVPSREEGQEVLFALERAPVLLTAIYMRDGDAKGALAELGKIGNAADDVVKPDLVRALEQLDEKPSARRWLKLGQAFGGRADGEDGAEAFILRFGILACVSEAYRLEPDLPETSGYLASAMLEFGFPEVAPMILVDAAKQSNDPRFLSATVAVILRAITEEIDSDDGPAARRAYRASLPILAQMDKIKVGAKLNPGPAQIYAVMGEVELRDGNVKEARAFLEKATAIVPLPQVSLLLARIDWHDKDAPKAIARIRDALNQPEIAQDPVLKGEMLAFLGEVTRDQGDVQAARTSLVDALKALGLARKADDAPTRARAERATARILDRFGAAQPAQRALERALDASRDKKQAAATVGQQTARALVQNDLKGAREALVRGIALELDDTDLVYYAMWVRFLERQSKATGESVTDRVLSQVKDDSRWIGKIAAFGLGSIKADDLVKLAATPAQKTEASFYVAMDRKVKGDAAALDALKQVGDAGSLELMEVTIARDLVLPGKRIPGPVPDVSP